MRSKTLASLIYMACAAASAAAFSVKPPISTGRDFDTTTHPLYASRRRALFVDLLVATTTPLLTLLPETARASGGATAGGAYLLSAKQRYNDRIKAGVHGFVHTLGPAILMNSEGDSDRVLRAFFSNDDAGSWKDFAAAGYLLANAFRRNSSAAPDTLPSVKVREKKRDRREYEDEEEAKTPMCLC
jgi:hypothetical protein